MDPATTQVQARAILPLILISKAALPLLRLVHMTASLLCKGLELARHLAYLCAPLMAKFALEPRLEMVILR